jgi:hypothetical protein
MTISRALLLGASACVLILVLTHIAETFHMFPSMGWACRIAPGTISI